MGGHSKHELKWGRLRLKIKNVKNEKLNFRWKKNRKKH